jgi:peptidyl-prolyl cis-trans isomerase C
MPAVSSKSVNLIVAGLMMGTALLLGACSEEEDSSPIVATVNDSPIRESEITAQLEGIPAQLLQGREDQVRQQILDQLIQRTLVLQEAERLNLDNDPEFQKQLHNLHDQLTYNTVIQKKLEEALTDDAVHAAYEATKAQRAFPAVKASHILVETKKDAEDILKVVTPKNFAEIAQAKSKGPSAQNGGDLGWFRKESMLPAFAEAAFATAPGTVAKQPVKTQFGWHVIYVEAKNDRFIPPFENVADALQAEMSQQIVQGYLADLKSKANIDIKQQETSNKDAAPQE